MVRETKKKTSKKKHLKITKSRRFFKKKKIGKEESFILEGLNNKQKSAVLKDDRKLLVIAGAGSGKTKTIIQKILYLISKQNATPSEILAITFTKNATNEMIDRLILASDTEGNYTKLINNNSLPIEYKDEARRNYIRRKNWLSTIKIKTFHSYCYDILRSYGSKQYDNQFKVITDKNYEPYEIFSFNKAPETPQQILHKIVKELSIDRVYLLDLKRYILDWYVEPKRISNRFYGHKEYEKPYVTLRGESVRSKSERYIADWLYLNNIDYAYEPNTNISDFEFKPDFYIPSANLFLEHISNLSANIPEKEQQLKIGGKRLLKTYESMVKDIRSFYEYLEKNIFPQLDDNINKDTALRVENEFKQYGFELNIFIEMVERVINKIKTEGIDKNEVFKRGVEDQHDRVKKFYELSNPIMDRFDDYYLKRSYIDFNDMIKWTVSLLKGNSDIKDHIKKGIRYILVDEFQDVNTLQVELLKELIDKNTQLFCVGDDWQSIYGWRGSEVGYIVNFKKYFPESNIIKLSLNYRSNDTIVKASNEVIKNNKFKIDKGISSFNKEVKKIHTYYSQKENEDGVEKVEKTIKNLHELGYIKEDILILYRRTKAREGYYEKLRDYATFRTMHGSKGLEAKIVFIIGLTQEFPKIFESDRIMQIIKKSNVELLMEEERRLFYVALTRAKEELFLITEIGNESEFIKEIPDKFKDKTNFIELRFKRNENKKCNYCNYCLEEKYLYCPFCGKKIESGGNILPQETEMSTKNIMTNFQFNEDGSVKLPEHLIRLKQNEKESIVLRRVQINTNNPAIANLRIEFPENVENPKRIIEYYKDIKNRRFQSVNHTIKQIDGRTFVIEVESGTKYMYSLLDYLLECFKEELKKQKPVVIRGNWDRFNSSDRKLRKIK